MIPIDKLAPGAFLGTLIAVIFMTGVVTIAYLIGKVLAGFL